jgi:hypothetical protein
MSLKWKNDFANPRQLADFKVADLACGTGTLLMAGAQALTDRYISDRAAQDMSLSEKDISTLHQTLMQNVLHGYDILPTAVRRFNSEVQQRCIDDMAEHRGWGKGRGQGRKSPAAMRA